MYHGNVIKFHLKLTYEISCNLKKGSRILVGLKWTSFYSVFSFTNQFCLVLSRVSDKPVNVVVVNESQIPIPIYITRKLSIKLYRERTLNHSPFKCILKIFFLCRIKLSFLPSCFILLPSHKEMCRERIVTRDLIFPYSIYFPVRWKRCQCSIFFFRNYSLSGLLVVEQFNIVFWKSCSHPHPWLTFNAIPYYVSLTYFPSYTLNDSWQRISPFQRAWFICN